MQRLINMFKLEPMVKINDLWRAAYRNGYDKPRIVHRIGMYEMVWLVAWAVFAFRTDHSKVAFIGLAMLILGLLWMYIGPIVSILDTDSGRIRRLTRKDYHLYRQQMRGKVAWPKPSEVGIGANEKLPKVKK